MKNIIKNISHKIISMTLIAALITGYGAQIIYASTTDDSEAVVVNELPNRAENAPEQTVEEIAEEALEEVAEEAVEKIAEEALEETAEEALNKTAAMALQIYSAEKTDEIVETNATFFVLRRDKPKNYRANPDTQYYINLGTGTILREEAMYDDFDAIAAAVGKMPNNLYLAGLASNETIVWYRTINYNGKWRVFGEIAEKTYESANDPEITEPETTEPEVAEPEVAEPEVAEPEVIEPVIVEASATFFVLRRDKPKNYRSNPDTQYYINLGTGTILREEAMYDDLDAIANAVGKMPNNLHLAELAANETIVWYRTIMYNGKWRAYGEITEVEIADPVKKDETLPSIDPVIEDETPVEEPAVVDAAVPEKPAVEAPASETIRDLLYWLITTGNTEVQDVSKYALTFTQLYDLYNYLYKNDCRIAVNCYYNLAFSTTTENGKVKTFKLVNADSGFAKRYQKTLAAIEEIMSGVDDKMTDMEKTLAAHEYIVSTTYYAKKDSYSHVAGGLFGDGFAVCDGYSRAMELVLNEMGIETQHIGSDSMNHSWLMVHLDGEWYHIDPTWDDTRSQISGEVSHKYFIRSEYEFTGSLGHYGWNTNSYVTLPRALSNAYASWFVHDVVGQMYYSNGEWYYTWGQDIVKSKIDGTNRVVLKSGNGSTLKITSFNDGEFTYAKR